MTAFPISSSRRPALSLSNDLVFKTLFSRHLHLLSDLINAVRYRYPPIRVCTVKNPNILPEDLAGKQIVLDILVEDAQGTRFNIEMQLRSYLHWPERNVYYLARALADQLQAGQDYRHLQPAIGISLLAHDLFLDHPDQADWHFSLRDTEKPGVRLGQALQVHIIELSKAESLHAFPPALTAWIACVRHNLEEDRMSQIEHPPVREALKHLEHMYSEEELRMAAERRVQALVDEQDALDYATMKGLEQGRMEGREEGRVEGLETGRKQTLADTLKRLLQRKFGALDTSHQEQLRDATTAQLEGWTDRLLDATTLEEVFC